MGPAIARIQAEEEALRRVEMKAESFLREQAAVADEVRDRIARAASVLKKAKMAWRGGPVERGTSSGGGDVAVGERDKDGGDEADRE